MIKLLSFTLILMSSINPLYSKTVESMIDFEQGLTVYRDKNLRIHFMKKVMVKNKSKSNVSIFCKRFKGKMNNKQCSLRDGYIFSSRSKLSKLAENLTFAKIVKGKLSLKKVVKIAKDLKI